MAEEPVQACDTCGASVYAEMVVAATAGVRGGKLLCPQCFSAGSDESASESITRVRHTTGITFQRQAEEAVTYRRALDPSSPHATRCRTFHCKLSDASFGHLNQQVNEFVDAHEEVAIKFATSTVGVVEGKHADPHLIVTIFY
jgi:hypothetical protein